MEQTKTPAAAQKTPFWDKLFGGINMTWPKVLIFALATAIVTAIVLIVPVFKYTSFQEMGVHLEAWILFAVIIMSNCKSPLDSAVKTFVFFLVSQPLIYLFQVPFSDMGVQLFQYYYRWFILTLLTFPMAFVGWYIKKKNWLSLLIFAPIIGLLAYSGFNYGKIMVADFPYHTVATLFCFGQILLYLWVFCKGIVMRLVGLAIPIAVGIVFFFTMPRTLTSVSMPLSGVHLSEAATIRLEDESFGTAKLLDFEDAYVSVSADKLGSTTMLVKDGDKEYRYTVTAYHQDFYDRIDIVPLSPNVSDQ